MDQTDAEVQAAMEQQIAMMNSKQMEAIAAIPVRQYAPKEFDEIENEVLELLIKQGWPAKIAKLLAQAPRLEWELKELRGRVGE